MDEDELVRKLRLIEALHAGATTDGERQAAAHARDRIIARAIHDDPSEADEIVELPG